jgi:FtsP/CotA-like multicopper oxidase with cupredoxin domain
LAYKVLAGYFPCSNVTNGAPCTNVGISKFQFESGKAYRLRLITSGAEPTIKFSIDNHTLTVMANDLVPVIPYDTEIVTLAVGQRTDVVVQAEGCAEDSFFMRSTFDSLCSDTNTYYGLAAVYYENADTTTAPNSIGYEVPQNAACTNDPLNTTEPAYPMTPPEPSTTFELRINLAPNGTLSRLWTMNNSSFYSDINEPVMLLAVTGNQTFGSMRNVYNMGSNSSVRMIVYNEYRGKLSAPGNA